MRSLNPARVALTALVTLGLLSAGTLVAFADDSTPPADAASAVTEVPASDPPAADPPAPDLPSDAPPESSPPPNNPPAADPPAADPPAAEPQAEPPATDPPAATTSGGQSPLKTQRTTSAGSLPDVTLCHATQGFNAWHSQRIDAQGAYNGHVDPPSHKNDHLNDIIPGFSYKDHGVTKWYPGKNLNTVFGNALGSAILANGCALPDPTPYKLLAWSLPCGAANLWCPPGQTLVHVLDLSTPSLNALDKTLLGTCNDWQVDLEWDSATTAALIAIGVLTGPNQPTEDHAYGAVPGNPWKFIDNPECHDPIVVTPAAVATDQTCSGGLSLTGGVITVTPMAGVTYTITDSSAAVVPFDSTTGATAALPPGAYSVAFSIAPGYTTGVASPIPLTIAAYTGPCGVVVTPAAVATDQGCVRNILLADGHIAVTIITGVTYTITDAAAATVPYDATTGLTGDLPPGNYSVAFALDLGYTTGVTSPIPLTIAAYPDDCAPIEVTPAAVATPDDCVQGLLTGGSIQLTLLAGVTYAITDAGANVVPYDALSGLATGLTPGNYSVGFVLDPLYTTSLTSPLSVTVDPYDGTCDLPTHPLVVPKVVFTPPTCTAQGTYTLSNDLGIPAAVTWTVDGTVGVPAGTYSVPTGHTVTIEAAPTPPDYGFGLGQQTLWTYAFSLAGVSCAEGLAFTGATPQGAMSVAALLLVSGLLALRARARRARVN